MDSLFQVIIKNPSDFVGDVVGGSEANTKGILANSRGKVLVIDEAYGLYEAKGNSAGFRTAVVDTIVAEVQSTAGEDRCVLLLGYKDQMEEMFQVRPAAHLWQDKRKFIHMLGACGRMSTPNCPGASQ